MSAASSKLPEDFLELIVVSREMESYSLKKISSLDCSTENNFNSDDDDDSESDKASVSIYSGASEDGSMPYLHKAAWSTIKRCWICDKHLTKLKGRRRHHCRYCGNTVCREHASTKLVLDGLTKAVRICDNCNKKLINTKHNTMLLAELNQLSISQSMAVKTINEQEHLQAELMKDVERLKFELSGAEAAAKESKAGLENRVTDESARNLKNVETRDSLTTAVEDSKTALEIAQERFDKKLIDVTTAKNENAHLLEQTQALAKNVEVGVKSMQDRVHIAQVTKIMCEVCRTKLYNMSFTEPSTEGSQQIQRDRSKSMVERKACAGDCEVM